MRRPTVSTNVAATIAALGWLVVPCVVSLGTLNRGPNSAQTESMVSSVLQAYQLGFAALSLFVGYLLYAAWRAAPPRVSWLAWNSNRQLLSALWTAALGAPAVLLLAAAVTEALEGRFLFTVVATVCAVGALAFRALMATAPLKGRAEENTGIRLSRMVVLALPLFWGLTVKMDEHYGGPAWNSDSSKESIARGLWRSNPAWQDSVIPALRVPYRIHEVFVEERARVRRRWFILRDLHPTGEYGLVVVARSGPTWNDNVSLAGVALRDNAAADTVPLRHFSMAGRFMLHAGTVRAPVPDSVRLHAVLPRQGSR